MPHRSSSRTWRCASPANRSVRALVLQRRRPTQKGSLMAKYGISTWLVQGYAPQKAVSLLADAGFHHVEISGANEEFVPAWEEDPVGVSRLLRGAGLEAVSVHGPIAGRRLDAPDAAVRKAAIAANVAYFDLMRMNGIPEIVIHPNGGADTSNPAACAAAGKHARESLEVLADRARRAGVRMAVENLGRPPTPGSSISRLLDLIDGLGDHVGLCFDVGHAEQAGLDLLCELHTAIASGQLFSLHLHDVAPNGVDHFIPGEGRIDWNAFVPALDADKFSGGRTLELSPHHGNPSMQLRRAGKLREQWEAGAFDAMI